MWLQRVVVDCVGSPQTIDLALRLVRATGKVVLAGAAGEQPMSWALVWKREITLKGTTDPGPESKLGGRRTREQTLEWLADRTFPVDGMVTHAYGLSPLAAVETHPDPSAGGGAWGCGWSGQRAQRVSSS